MLEGDDDDDDDDDIENAGGDTERERAARERRAGKLLTPLKPRIYSQFSGVRSSATSTKPRSLLRTPKHKGPPGLPVRRTRTFVDIKPHYSHITDDAAYHPTNRFTFNDFLLHATGANARPYEETTAERAFLSKYTYRQVCEMIAERVWAERGEGGQVSASDARRHETRAFFP